MATNTTDLLKDVNAGMATAETALNNKLLDAVFEENEGLSNSDELETFKDQVGVTGVNKTEVPNAVYEAVATAVLNALKSSTITKLSTNQTTRTKEIGAAISGGLSSIYNQQIPVNGNNYTVSVTIMSLAGLGNCFADVSWKTSTGTTKKAHLTWTNVGTENGNQALAKFCSVLADLNTQLWKEFASYALTGSTRGKKIYDFAEKIIKAISDKKSANELIKEIGTIFSTELKSTATNKFRNFIKNNVPGGDVIIASVDLLKTLETKKAALETAVSNNKNVDAKLKDFNKACTNLEKKLGTSIGTFTLEPPTGLSYNSKYTEMTISGAYGNQLNISDYRENVAKINASTRSTAIEIEGNNNANQIYGGSGADKISGGIGKDIIYGGNGKDSLYGESDADKLYGDAEDDMLSGGDKNDTLYGGEGNDSLYGDKDADKLFGDSGNDTLVGGLGKDTLTGGDGADVFVYANGDGDDTILDYVSGQDKIKISSGSVNSYSVSGGKDAVLKVGKGKITLKGVGNNQITVITSDNKTVTYGGIASGLTFNKADLPKATSATINSNYSGKFESGAYASLATINASSRTNAIEVVGNKKANKIQGGSSNDILRGGDGKDTLYGGSGNDSLYGDKEADKLYGDAGNDTLVGGLGNDTLTGGAGNDIFYYSNGDGEDVIADFTSNDDKIYISGATSVTGSLSKNDVTFKVGKKGSIKVQNVKDKEITIAYSNGTEKKYVNGILSSSTDTTTGGGGDYNAPTVVLTSSMSNPFILDNYNKTATTKAVNIDARNIDTRNRNTSFTIYGDDKNNIIVASKGVSYIYAGKGNDEIYFNDGQDYLYYYNGDGNEVVYNCANNDRIYASYDANIKSVTLNGNDVILNVGRRDSTTATNTITLKNAKDTYIQTYNWYDTRSDYGHYATFGLVSFSGNTAVLDANYHGDFYSKWYTAKPANINASAVTRYPLTIIADDSDNVIWTGKSSNYVHAGKGNDTIYFNDGYDCLTYGYGDGNETIYNFSHDDKVEVLGYADIKSITLSGNDVIFNIGHSDSTTATNTITLKNAKDKYIKIYNSNHNNTAFGGGFYATFGLVNISGSTAVLDANYNGTFDLKWYSAEPANINASAVTCSLNIYADDGDNVIWTGKNRNYVHAGKGNDTIYFNDGYDCLEYGYGDGNETIYNYDIEDSIYLNSSEAKLNNISYSGNDAILNLTSGNTITLKNAKNTAIRINGYSSGIYNQSSSSTSARVAEDYWFAEDNNFVDNDTSVDSIMEENYSVTNIETSDFDSLTNDEFTLTYNQTEDQK